MLLTIFLLDTKSIEMCANIIFGQLQSEVGNLGSTVFGFRLTNIKKFRNTLKVSVIETTAGNCGCGFSCFAINKQISPG